MARSGAYSAAMSSRPPPAVPAPNGYVSQEGKQHFTMIVGVLAAVCFIAQFVIPMIAGMVIMPLTMAHQVKAMAMPDVERAALWNGHIWYPEVGIDQMHGMGTVAIQKAGFDAKVEPETVIEVIAAEPALLPGKDRLWIITSAWVKSYHGGLLRTELRGDKRGDLSRPFVLDGRPAVIEKTPAGLSILSLGESGWVKVRSFPRLTEDDEDISVGSSLRIVSGKDTQHLFLKYGTTLYYREGLPEADADIVETWQAVADCGSAWSAAIVQNRPVIVYTRGGDDNPWSAQIVILQRDAGGWAPVPAGKHGILGEYAAFGEPDSDRLVLVCAGFPGSLRLVEMRGTKVTRTVRFGGGFPFSRGMMYMMMVPYSFMFLIPLLLAVLYSLLMRKYRVCDYRAAERTVPFAPLWRRAVAQIVDAGIAGAPSALGMMQMMTAMMDMEAMLAEGGPLAMFANLGLMVGGGLWGLLCFLLFAFCEGHWGATPGKWLLKIRVLGAEDLQPCGFGRAFLRGILKFVDGFFNFMVGLILVAFTENWQRVGDMAARTVVIDVGRPDVRGRQGFRRGLR